MFSTFYHKKASVLKIPLHPPLPKWDNKDDGHIFISFLPKHFHDEPVFIRKLNVRVQDLSVAYSFNGKHVGIFLWWEASRFY